MVTVAGEVNEPCAHTLPVEYTTRQPDFKAKPFTLYID